MPKRERDTRRILRGVQLPGEEGEMKTFAAGMEDELEAVMSPGQHAYLVASGAIEGDWSPEGEPPAPVSVPEGRRKADARAKLTGGDELAEALDGERVKRAEQMQAKAGKSQAKAEPASEGEASLESLTVAELDELAAKHAVEEYPGDGRKADKVAALELAGVKP